MKFQIEEGRIYIEKEEKLLAEIEYEKIGENEYNIYHTFVDESLRGQGIASKLVEMAVNEINKKNGKVSATCSYANAWLERHNLV
ncbi:MAG: N-acetyltransferase [Clostridia bacterium]|nr:N-acetyltransferase [Clostridia bacterium]